MNNETILIKEIIKLRGNLNYCLIDDLIKFSELEKKDILFLCLRSGYIEKKGVKIYYRQNGLELDYDVCFELYKNSFISSAKKISLNVILEYYLISEIDINYEKISLKYFKGGLKKTSYQASIRKLKKRYFKYF